MDDNNIKNDDSESKDSNTGAEVNKHDSSEISEAIPGLHTSIEDPYTRLKRLKKELAGEAFKKN